MNQVKPKTDASPAPKPKPKRGDTVRIAGRLCYFDGRNYFGIE